MILEDVTSAAIYSDSDVIFVKPIDELWAQMKHFDKRHVVAISPTAGHPLGGSEFNENFIPHDSGLFQINSGVSVVVSRLMLIGLLRHYFREAMLRFNVRTSFALI